MLIKPMQTRILLQQIEKLLTTHESKKAKPADPQPTPAVETAATSTPKKAALKKTATKRRVRA